MRRSTWNDVRFPGGTSRAVLVVGAAAVLAGVGSCGGFHDKSGTTDRMPARPSSGSGEVFGSGGFGVGGGSAVAGSGGACAFDGRASDAGLPDGGEGCFDRLLPPGKVTLPASTSCSQACQSGGSLQCFERPDAASCEEAYSTACILESYVCGTHHPGDRIACGPLPEIQDACCWFVTGLCVWPE